MREIKRGDIYFADLNPVKGSELMQRKWKCEVNVHKYVPPVFRYKKACHNTMTSCGANPLNLSRCSIRKHCSEKGLYTLFRELLASSRYQL